MVTQRGRPAEMIQHSGPSRAPHGEAQAPRSGLPAPNPAKLATCVSEEGEVLEEKQQASVPVKRPPGRTAGLPGAAPGTPEAQRVVPGLAGQQTLLKDKGGPPWALAWASRAPARAGPGEGNKGAKRVSRQQPRRPRQGPGTRSRPAARHPDLSPGPSDHPRSSRLPSPQALTGLVVPKRSSPAPSRPRAEPGPAAALEFPGSRRPRRSSRVGGTGKAVPRPSSSSAGTW